MQCDYFDANACRSCTFMGVPYAAQLADKDAHCHEVLGPVAPGLSWSPPFAGGESGFRNKAKLVVGGTPGAVTLGILGPDGTGVDLRECGLYEEQVRDVLPRVAQVVEDLGLEPYDVPTRRGELKHVILTAAPSGALMMRLVLRSQKHLALLRSRLARIREAVPALQVVSVNLQPEHKAVLEGDTEILLTSEETLTMRVNDIDLHLRPASFFQTNTVVASGLYRQARDWVAELAPDRVLDLYCGVGGFALHCAELDPAPELVLGIEVAPEAVASARRSSEDLGLGARVHFEVGDVTDVARLEPTFLTGGTSVVVVNPPRRGIGADLCDWLEDSDADALVYSSCNVDSLARDLARLPSFTASHARLFDMFPQTNHHEVIVLLVRDAERVPGRVPDGVSG